MKTPDPSNRNYIHGLKQECGYSIIGATATHCPSNLGIDEWLREADWSKCLCCLVLTHRDGATQKAIIQQHK